MTTFVDTSALLALLDGDDPQHAAADETFRFLFQGEPLVIHAYAVVETAAVVQRKLGMSAVRDLFDRLLPMLKVDLVDQELHDAAVTSLIAAANRRVSLVDWTSFAYMRRDRIDDVFTFDVDFAEQGFSVVPPLPGQRSAISR